jgi:prepilin-type N-terminal cleavage/methylation domain-containing protein
MKSFYLRLGNGSGFTLVELLIVILILGILSAIAVPLFMGQRTKAMITEAESNLDIMRLLEEQFFAENGEYAPDDKNAAGTIAGIANIQGYLTGFKPGAEDRLKFYYSIDYTVGAGAITNSFTAIAYGKGGTPVEDMCYQIDEDNVFGVCP